MKTEIAVMLLLLVTLFSYAKGKKEATQPSSPPESSGPSRPTNPEPPRIYQTDERIQYYMKIKNDDGAEVYLNAMKWMGCKFMSA